MLFLPITRPWAAERVVSAFDNSDCPKRVKLLIDTDEDITDWILLFDQAGWEIVDIAATGNPAPPTNRVDRRARHLAMRWLSQNMTAYDDKVLYSEDDTLVPPDVWSLLSESFDAGYDAVTGVQRDRHGTGLTGIWHYDREVEVFDPPYDLTKPEPRLDGFTFEADACGHYCLMTSGQLYANTPIPAITQAPIDRTHTFGMGPIRVDTRVWCGHLTESGEVIE